MRHYRSRLRARSAILGAIAFVACTTAIRAEHRVAGLNELVVYAPGTHERGLPSVELQATEAGTFVDVPPTVHVHRYYFDGSKEYQGPILQGGPTVVVANHPRSGRKMYIEVNLPAGAPVIAYSPHCITYAYKERRVVIEFSCTSAGDDHATVRMLPGKGVLRVLRDHARRKDAQNARQGTPKGKLGQAVCDAGKSAAKSVTGAAGIVTQTAGSAIDTGRKVVEALPPVNILQSAANQGQQFMKKAPTSSSIFAKTTKMPTSDVPTIR